MKLIPMAGTLLTAIGVIPLIYQGVTFTTREKVVDFGPLQTYKEEKKTIPVPPNHRRVGHRGWNFADRRRSQEEVTFIRKSSTF